MTDYYDVSDLATEVAARLSELKEREKVLLAELNAVQAAVEKLWVAGVGWRRSFGKRSSQRDTLLAALSIPLNHAELWATCGKATVNNIAAQYNILHMLRKDGLVETSPDGKHCMTDAGRARIGAEKIEP